MLANDSGSRDFGSGGLRCRSRAGRTTAAVWLLIAVSVSLCAGDDTSGAKASAYAPAKDLAAQLEAFVKQIEGDLANEGEYKDEQKDRVAKDANTVIVLAQVLAHHDEDHPLRKAAPGIQAAAVELAGAVEEHADAKAALGKLKQAMATPGEGEPSWEPAAEIGQLMKQVPIVNNRLRLGVMGKRFDRTIEQNAGLATTLAAIAQASLHDKAYCSSKEEESTWEKICVDMRSAAAEIREAVRKKDQAAAKVGLDKMVKTCDACHADFRD